MTESTKVELAKIQMPLHVTSVSARGVQYDTDADGIIDVPGEVVAEILEANTRAHLAYAERPMQVTPDGERVGHTDLHSPANARAC